MPATTPASPAAGSSGYENEGLVIRNSTISGNDAGEWGGGIYISTSNYAAVEIYNSTISGNSAGEEGGGIAFNSYYGLTIVQSTITNNRATTFGGIYMSDSGAQATANSQEKDAKNAARQAEKDAAALANGNATAQATGERRESRVRAADAPDEVTLSGTIVAGNVGTDIGDSGTVTTKGSLIGTIVGSTLVDQGGNLYGILPGVGALANNGGPTQTHALLPGSPAIDTGPNPLSPFQGASSTSAASAT